MKSYTKYLILLIIITSRKYHSKVKIRVYNVSKYFGRPSHHRHTSNSLQIPVLTLVFKMASPGAVFRILALLIPLHVFVLVECVFPFAPIDLKELQQPQLETEYFPAADPLLETSTPNYTKIREDAEVEPFVENVKSYAGFIEVNSTYQSNLFYWFFESENKPAKDPLLLWLHGGPGQSSLMGLFEESGPYKVINSDVVYRNTTWTKYYNVLYIDNPVGAGYSYTKNSDGYSRTVQQAAVNLYKGLVQFFEIYSSYRKNAFYITGESYCGKYIPALASIIHDENQKKKTASEKIKLKGLFIGCGFMDPVNQMYFGDYYYQMGIVDPPTRDDILDHEEKARNHIRRKNFYLADFHLTAIGAKIYKKGYTIDATEPNFDFSSYDDVERFVQRDDVRKKIHVGNAEFQDRKKVTWYFRDDMWNSISSELSKLINENYKVLLYAGQYDMVVPHTQIDRVVDNLSWEGKNDLRETEASNWYVGNELAGFKKRSKNVIKVMVRKSNHIIVRSQPKWMLDLLRCFI